MGGGRRSSNGFVVTSRVYKLTSVMVANPVPYYLVAKLVIIYG